ncbi:Protein unc-45, partial [Intoshia linei]
MKPLNTGNDEFIEYKELAKSFIKSNDYKKAQEMYELALKNFELSDENKFLIINNISLCNFKLENYLETIKYATEVLEYDQGNEKARYRRCVCYNYVKKIKEALIDVKFLINLNPKSMLYIQLFNETSKNATDKVNDHFSVDVRIDKIYKQVFDNENKSHVVNGLKKIIGLITDENRTKTAVSKNLLNKLFELYSSKWVSSDFEIKTWIMKIYVIISNINKNYSLKIYRMLDLCILKTSICEKHETKNYETFCTIVGNLLSSFVFMACGIKNLMDQREQYNLESLKKQESGEYRSNFGDIMDKIDEKESLRLIQIYTFLIDNVDSKKISIFGRLAILRTLLTFLKKDTSCGWSIKLIKIDEMNKLLGLCSVVNNISILSTNENIKNTLSAILTKISDDVQSKKHSEIFKDSITEYLQFSMQNYNDFNSKLELLSCLGVLFNGPRKQILSFISCIPIFDLINNVLETANNDFIKYTLNILIIVISKNISNDNSAKLVRKLNDICENVAMSDSIRILSLLALCKLGSIGGRDADSKSFHEKSYTVLAEECKRHLKCKIEDFSAVHSLIECIGYLSFNANVKEIIVQDHVCVKHLMSQYAFKSTTAYVYVKMLSNLTNSYEEKKSDEQMEKLAKTAKTHVPVKFEKDLLEYAKNRRQIFLDAGLVQQLNRLISLSNVYVDLEVC